MMTESERLTLARSYFEDGCLCIHTGQLDPCDNTVDDETAIKFYENNCKCTRNYVHLENNI